VYREVRLKSMVGKSEVVKIHGSCLYTERCGLYEPDDILEFYQNLESTLQEKYFDSVSITLLNESQNVSSTLLETDFQLPFKSFIGRNHKIVDIGGVPNLLNPEFHNISYSIDDIVQSIEIDRKSATNVAIFGASAADAVYLQTNGELMPVESVIYGSDGCGDRTIGSFSAIIDQSRESVGGGNENLRNENGCCCKLQRYNHSRIGFLGNLFVCEGQGDTAGSNRPLLKIIASKRKDESINFVSAIRNCLKELYPEEGIGLGGIFTMKAGRFKAHVMPDFKDSVMEDGPEVNEWLEFFEFDSNATFLSVLVSQDPSINQSMNLRLEHTHFYNEKTKQGGHYHHDTTPETVIYEGYFTFADSIYRIENAFDRSRSSIHSNTNA